MSDDFEVGYRKPPKGPQFKKGESGNPKGRPKGSKNLTTLLDQELDAPVSVIENGKRRRISKLQAAVKQLANKAASGDPKAFTVISTMSMEREEGNRGEAAAKLFSAPHDEAVIKLIIDRIRRAPSPVPEREADDSDAEDDKC